MLYKTKFWVILFAVIFVLAAGAFYLLWNAGAAGKVTARLWQDGEIVREIELSTVVVPEEFDFTTELGTNRIRVEHGGIRVVSADCPDQTCVHMGLINGPYQTIACIPHDLVIDIVTEDGA